jgi:hypothetical protein
MASTRPPPATWRKRRRPPRADGAFEWLERAYAQHDSGLLWMKVDPDLKNLHGDPRFAALLRKMRLPV